MNCLSVSSNDALKIMAAALAGSFHGASFYVSGAEHGARMELDTVNCRKEWAGSFNRAKKFMSSFALFGSLAGAGVYYCDPDCKNRSLWLLGGGILFLNLPYTLLYMLPDIKRNLKEDAIEKEGETWVRDHIVRWNRQHIPRILTGCIAFDIFLYALLKN